MSTVTMHLCSKRFALIYPVLVHGKPKISSSGFPFVSSSMLLNLLISDCPIHFHTELSPVFTVTFKWHNCLFLWFCWLYSLHNSLCTVFLLFMYLGCIASLVNTHCFSILSLNFHLPLSHYCLSLTTCFNFDHTSRKSFSFGVCKLDQWTLKIGKNRWLD